MLPSFAWRDIPATRRFSHQSISCYTAHILTVFTGWVESTALSIWVRESPSLLAFPFILIVHAWGMGFLAGSNAALSLRILGAARQIPLSAMARFYPVMWFGFTINAISGLFLLVGYPTKALTNPVFYIKIGCIAAGMALMIWTRDHIVRSEESPTFKGRAIAALSLLVWAGAIISGRLLAYTCKFIMAGIGC